VVGALSRESFLPNVTIVRLLKTEKPRAERKKSQPKSVARRKDENANETRTTDEKVDDR
jgi:hypothetical protein